MPFGDGTGPAGYGPMTGRRIGYCAGYNVPGFQNRPGYGRGFGHGRGFARGLRRGYGFLPYSAPVYPYYVPFNNPGLSKEDELDYLKETARVLEEELSAVKEQLKKIEDDNT